MTDTKQVEFTTIKDVEVNFETIFKTNKAKASASRKGDKALKAGWATTCLYVAKHGDLSKIDANQELDVIGDAVRKIFNDAVEADPTFEIPTNGKNARTGKTMTIRNDKGVVKWNSWEGSKASWSYCGDLAKGIKAGKINDLLPGDNKVMARNAFLKLCKKPETPQEAVNRGLELIEANLEALDVVGMSDLEVRLNSIGVKVSDFIDLMSKVQKAA